MKHRSLSQHLAALAMLLMALTPLLTACVDEDEYADTPAGNFEALWRILDEHYCFFDYKRQTIGPTGTRCTHATRPDSKTT